MITLQHSAASPERTFSSLGIARSDRRKHLTIDSSERIIVTKMNRLLIKITDKLEEWLKNLTEMMVKCLKDRIHNAVYCYLDITKDVSGHEMWLEKITKDLKLRVWG